MEKKKKNTTQKPGNQTGRIIFSCLNKVFITMQASKHPYKAARYDFRPKWDLLSSSWEMEAREDILCGCKQINLSEFVKALCCLQTWPPIQHGEITSGYWIHGWAHQHETVMDKPERVQGRAPPKKSKGLKNLSYEEKLSLGQFSLEKSPGESHLLPHLYLPNATLPRLLLQAMNVMHYPWNYCSACENDSCFCEITRQLINLS